MGAHLFHRVRVSGSGTRRPVIDLSVFSVHLSVITKQCGDNQFSVPNPLDNLVKLALSHRTKQRCCDSTIGVDNEGRRRRENAIFVGNLSVGINN
jgi:hypothetical protein